MRPRDRTLGADSTINRARGRSPPCSGTSEQTNRRQRRHTAEAGTSRQHHAAPSATGRNPGDVRSISTRPFRQAHYAVFPIDLRARCIAAGCRPRGTVVAPFAGAATTGLAARELNRSFIGIEHDSAVCGLAGDRLSWDRNEPGGRTAVTSRRRENNGHQAASSDQRGGGYAYGPERAPTDCGHDREYPASLRRTR
ncbi:DNA methyltransferase [Actinoallomurus acaciae]|uniref:Methyltransferase n=1 Tax=Actinoallomurus acaciae TaxID=502577 RepID=A0ABV5Y712_9ACTN